jgi:hypothetical protein
MSEIFADDNFSGPQVANLLLAEYGTLRAEAVAKGALQFQVVAAGATATVATVGLIVQRSGSLDNAGGTLILFGMLASAIIFPIGFFNVLTRDVERLSGRISEIELTLNKLSGRDLLIWEHTQGILTQSQSEKVRGFLGFRI